MMSRTPTWIIAGLLAVGPALSVAQPLDLLQAYELALENDPQLREQRASRNATRENHPQARGALLPQLDFTASYDESVSDGERFDFDEDGEPGIIPFDREQETTRFNLSLSQTLFDWERFRELDRAHAQVAQADTEFEAELQDLAIRTAEAYFDLLEALDRKASSIASEESIERQRDRAQRRMEAGLVSMTDVQEAEAAYDQAVADRIAAERTVNLRREQLREIIGVHADEIVAPHEDIPLDRPEPTDPEAWVGMAKENNLRIAAARFGSQVSEQEVSQARAGHYPTLELTANLTRLEQDGGSVFDQQDLDTRSVGVQLNVPIYSGGQIRSRTRQAHQNMLAAEERLERQRREAERETIDAFLGVESERSRVQALTQAVRSNQVALEATQAGFEVGTRTTVDILEARDSLFRAQVDLARARYDFLLDTLRLKAATGALGIDDIRALNELMGAEPGEMISPEDADPEDLDIEQAQPPRGHAGLKVGKIQALPLEANNSEREGGEKSGSR